MYNLVIVGQVVNEPNVIDLKGGKFCYLVLKDGKELIRVYANNQMAVDIGSAIKEDMVVSVVCNMTYAKFTKYNDKFVFHVKSFDILFYSKLDYKKRRKTYEERLPF